MKKAIIILIISLFTCAALFAQEQAYEYKPLVEPGKTWWYEARQMGERPMAIGLRIGTAETIGGTQWYGCYIVDSGDRDNDLTPAIAYVRQDGPRFYYMPATEPDVWISVGSSLHDEIVNDVYQTCVHTEHMPAGGVLVCDLSAGKDDELDILGFTAAEQESDGTWKHFHNYYKAHIDNIGYITSCDIERKILSGKCDNTDINFIDGIGETGSDWSGFFFSPVHMRPTGFSYWDIFLRGVVDADENLLWAADESIVHPWELAGADDAVADKTAWSYADGEIRCAADATIRVLDTTGRETLAPVRVAAGGTLKPALDSGIYILEVTTDAGRDVRKIAR